MSIVVLGDGLLGTELIKQTGWDCISRKKNNFDIRDDKSYQDIFLNSFKTIVNCIANTDTYSDDRQLHWDVNYKSVVKLTDFCSRHNIKLVHISTDYVYSNSVNEASEDDVPIHGNNWYSYTKLLGDSYVQLSENNLVIRESHKKNPFIYENAWINQIGNFDYVNVIASLIIQLIDKNAVGVINVGTELKTMYDLALTTNSNVHPSLGTLAPTNVSMNISKMREVLK